MNQHEWVEGCYAYYRENDLEPGNPEDGNWHLAHYPEPKCLGGTEVILLLEEHHAVQGVLQAEEYQHPCVYGWEKRYLTGELLELFYKWKAECGRRLNAGRTPESYLEGAAKAIAVRRAKGWDLEALGKAGLVGGATTWQRREGMFKKLNTPEWAEKSSVAGKRGCAVTNAQRWRCKTTGYVSTSAGVVRYQSLRGIDTSRENRERLPDT